MVVVASGCGGYGSGGDGGDGCNCDMVMGVVVT